MQDRFKFRIALHQDKYEEYGLEKFKNQRIFEVTTLNICVENSTVEIIADYPNGDWAVREIDEADVDLMQCTGLKDKNGKLIYENDIVKFYFDNDEIIAILTWDNEESRFYLNTTDYFKDKYITDYEITKQEQYEVIGNIYETPELIKE